MLTNAEASRLAPKQFLKIIETSERGLSYNEAKKRLKIFGRNEISGKKKHGIVRGLLYQFKSPLIILLLITASLSVFLKQSISAIIVFCMVILSVILNFAQEYKARRAAEKLKEKIKTKVEVMRAGRKQEIKIEEIVPGDVVVLSAGSIIPTDCRLIKADDFFVNEASLTGESFPVKKSSEAIEIEDNAQLTRMGNFIFMGTNVISGSALAVTIKTGKDTQFGNIAKKLSKNEMPTEFEKGIKDFGFFVMRTIFFLVVLVFFLNAFARHDILQSILFSLALAVGLTPELLPMIVSVTMARGSINMSRHGVIVKKLNSIPNFGSMDILCTDKTGTLTENAIKLIKHIDIEGRDSEKVLLYTYINSFFQLGITNPLDDAVLKGRKVNIKDFKKIDEIPFDFSRKRISIIAKNKEGLLFITKGAPEEIFKICEHCGDAVFSKTIQKKAVKLYQKLSEDGYRVLAVAVKKIKQNLGNYPVSEEKNMNFAGFVAFLDPPKLAVREALDMLEAQKIEIKILTGDNELVTKKICQEVDVKVKGILLGEEIADLPDEALRVKVEKTTIFARLDPEQKDRIILALKENGHCVGYLGDGINDALPLAAADVGISVNNGVDVAKESADLILLNKSLRVLSQGVREGRRTFGNTMKYILMGVSSNFGNMFSVAIASFILPFLPMLPIQILLNNFLYDFSQLGIPADSVDEEYLAEPKRWDIKFIKKFMWTFGSMSSLFDVITYSILFFIFGVSAAVFQTSWFLESIMSQILVIFIIRTRKTFFKSKPPIYLILSCLGILAIGLAIPYSFLGKYFGFSPPPFGVFAVIWILTFAYLLLVDLLKKKVYKNAMA